MMIRADSLMAKNSYFFAAFDFDFGDFLARASASCDSRLAILAPRDVMRASAASKSSLDTRPRLARIFST